MKAGKLYGISQLHLNQTFAFLAIWLDNMERLMQSNQGLFPLVLPVQVFAAGINWVVGEVSLGCWGMQHYSLPMRRLAVLCP